MNKNYHDINLLNKMAENAAAESKPDELHARTMEKGSTMPRRKTTVRKQMDPFGLLDDEEEDGPRRNDSLANLDNFLKIEDRFADDDDLPKRNEDRIKERGPSKDNSFRTQPQKKNSMPVNQYSPLRGVERSDPRPAMQMTAGFGRINAPSG